jgi:hypothetical protein
MHLAAALAVLFVGNSLTAANNLPATVTALGARDGITIHAEVRAPGGYALEDHWNLTDLHDAIANGRYDWVVMQQGPSTLPESYVNLSEYATKIADVVRASGGKPALYGVWPESYRRSALDASIGNYRRAAGDSGSTLLPVGAAWKAAWKLDPKLALYGPDGFHPSRLGSYLAAVVIYAGLTGKPAVGLPRLFVAPKVARLLQRAAATALRNR